MDVLSVHVRRVELSGRVLLHRVDPAPLLHQCGPILRDRQTTQVPDQHDQAGGGDHAVLDVVRARSHLLPADLLRMVHHTGSQDRAQRVRF